METERDMFEFRATKQALASLQRLLFCCQCEQLTKNVCTLGNCEHFFCKQCVESHLGASCPVCDMPAHVRDAHVNKQLSNIVSMSLELSRLLQAPLTSHVSHKEEEGSAAVCAQKESPHQSPVPSPGGDAMCLQDMSTSPQAQPALFPVTCTNPCKPAAQKAAVRRRQKEAAQTALSPVSDERPSDQSDPEMCVRRNIPTKTDLHEKAKLPMPQTRMRSRKSLGSPQWKCGVTARKSNLVTDNAASEHEAPASDADVSSEDDASSASLQASPLPSLAATAKSRRGRQHQGPVSDASVKKTQVVNASDEPFKTPTPPRSRRRQSSGGGGSKVVSPSPSWTPAATASMPHTPSSRRRSAPVTPVQRATPTGQRRRGSASPSPPVHGTNESAVERRRRPVSPSPPTSRGTKVSASPVTSKSASRRSSDGRVGQLKRNAKGETPLHVAAIKGDLSAVRELLSRGEKPNVRDNAGWTPLHEAVNHGHTAVAEALLHHGALVNMPAMDNDTPLHDAVANGRLDCVHLLVTYGASTSARNVHGHTALEMARTDAMRAALLQTPTLQSPVVSRPAEPEDAEEFRPLCFLGTALSRDQRGLLQKCAAMLHARVVEDYCPEVSHVVSSVNSDGQCPRTLKYLQAVLGGMWVVSFDWVGVCLEYGQKVSEEPFEVPGSSTHPNSNAANKARINRKLQLPGLFDGCQVYLHGSFTRLPPSKAELLALLQLGGAHLLSREPRLANLDEYEVTVPYHAAPHSSLRDCGVFIMHDGGSSAPTLQAQRMKSLPASWVTECIATFSLLEPSVV